MPDTTDSITKANALFDDLVAEVWYGFNMRLEFVRMLRQSPELMTALEVIIDECRKARGG